MNKQQWDNVSRYFKRSEFDSPDVKGSGDNMQYSFIEKLFAARSVSNTPFRITSGYRTKQHNKKVGGKNDSSHLKGVAADIQVNNSMERFNILYALILAGFTRIGIGANFIHVDNDKDKTQGVIWTYY